MPDDEPKFDPADEKAADNNARISLDCDGLSGKALADHLLQAAGQQRIKLENCLSNVAGFGAGVAIEQAIIKVDGSVGDFAFLLNEETSWDVHGNAGQACAHSITSGRVLIRKHAGDYLAAFGVCGFVVAYGKAGDFVSHRGEGADVLVRSTVGKFAGSQMKSGVLVLANGAGEELGQGMTGGEIFVRGDVQSVSGDVRHNRLKDTDSMRLSLLLARSGIRGDIKEFKLYRARS